MAQPTTAPPRGRPVSAAPERRTGRRVRRHAWWTPYAFLAPFLAIFGTFVAFPAVLGVWMSLHDWDYLLPNKPFLGLDNYLNLFDSASSAFSDRKSTRLNSSHVAISYAVFCLKKKTNTDTPA